MYQVARSMCFTPSGYAVLTCANSLDPDQPIKPNIVVASGIRFSFCQPSNKVELDFIATNVQTLIETYPQLEQVGYGEFLKVIREFLLPAAQ